MGTNVNAALLSLFIALPGYCDTANSRGKIAVLEFELNDITSLPNTPAELDRTGSIKPLLEQAIGRDGNYDIVRISHAAQKADNAGFGYLFRFHDVAAKLGKKYGADWIIVGQHSKPSFLESSLIADVINVNTAGIAAELYVDLKGSHAKVTDRGVKELARQIIGALSSQKKSRQ